MLQWLQNWLEFPLAFSTSICSHTSWTHHLIFAKGHLTIDHQETAGQGSHWGRNTEGTIQHPHMWCRPASLPEVVAKAPAQTNGGLSNSTILRICDLWKLAKSFSKYNVTWPYRSQAMSSCWHAKSCTQSPTVHLKTRRGQSRNAPSKVWSIGPDAVPWCCR